MRAGGGTGKSRMILEVIPSKITSGCLRHGFNGYLKTERFESLNEVVHERFRVEAIEVVATKIPIQPRMIAWRSGFVGARYAAM